MEPATVNDFEKFVDFLSDIGITAEKVEETYQQETFIPGIEILEGEIFYTDKIRFSSLLHESGHVALWPQEHRAVLTNDIGKSIEEFFDELPEEQGWKLYERPEVTYYNDQSVMGWGYLVLKHLGIDIIKGFHDWDEIDNGLDVYESIKLCENYSRGSTIHLTNLFYGGFIESKSSLVLKKWTV